MYYFLIWVRVSFYWHSSNCIGLFSVVFVYTFHNKNYFKNSNNLIGILIGFSVIYTLEVQLTLEQHRFEQCGSTYTQIFFNSKHYSTIQSPVGWIWRCRTTDMEEPCIRRNWVYRRAYHKLYRDFRQHGGSAPLTPVLFKGQLYWQFKKFFPQAKGMFYSFISLFYHIFSRILSFLHIELNIFYIYSWVS